MDYSRALQIDSHLLPPILDWQESPFEERDGKRLSNSRIDW